MRLLLFNGSDESQTKVFACLFAVWAQSEPAKNAKEFGLAREISKSLHAASDEIGPMQRKLKDGPVEIRLSAQALEYLTNHLTPPNARWPNAALDQAEGVFSILEAHVEAPNGQPG